jgi:outer membrane protein
MPGNVRVIGGNMKRSSILALLLAAPAVGAEPVRIGYVDLQRAVSETGDGKRAKAKLQGLFKDKQSELDKKQEEFKKAKEELDRQKVMLKPEVQRQREKELQDRFVELQALYVKLQKELSQQEAEATKDIFAKLQRIIAKIADKEGFTMVLEKTESSILWAKPSLDLTNELIRSYNKGAK